ncbi:MAG: hypothetical protein ACYCYP_13435 [Leptospirales bacterium]
MSIKNNSINFCTLSHPKEVIFDQIDFLSDALKVSNYSLSVSEMLDPESINIVQEGFFSRCSSDYVREFCTKFQKKVVVILTEHMDIVGNGAEINGFGLNGANDVMDNAFTRFYNLCLVLPYIRSFAILGHFPDKDKIQKIFPAIPIQTIPYAPLDPKKPIKQDKKTDFSFTGTLTPYREKLLKTLLGEFRCHYGFEETIARRREVISESKFHLQIPQNKSWSQISPMRVLFSLKSGTPVLNISEYEDSFFTDQIIPRFPANDMKDLINNLTIILKKRESHDFLDSQVRSFNESIKATFNQSNLGLFLNIWQDLETQDDGFIRSR